jgi:hypothetical protein
MTQAIRAAEKDTAQPTVQQQAGQVLAQVTGYVGVRTTDIGLRLGLFEEMATHPDGITAEDLASAKRLDPFYTQVWCRAAYASKFWTSRIPEPTR